MVLQGHCPSKKNLYRRSRDGRLFLDHEVKAQIDALIVQAQNKWKRRSMKDPEIDVEFHVRDARGDRDNKLVTLMDVLQKAGVIANDNIAQCNGTVVLLPAHISPQEHVHVWVLEKQNALEIPA